jgi:uncharacterized protein with GYD domain
VGDGWGDDFVAVLSFPDLEAEFRSRNEVYKRGVFRAEHLPAIPMDEAIQLAGYGSAPSAGGA